MTEHEISIDEIQQVATAAITGSELSGRYPQIVRALEDALDAYQGLDRALEAANEVKSATGIVTSEDRLVVSAARTYQDREKTLLHTLIDYTKAILPPDYVPKTDIWGLLPR